MEDCSEKKNFQNLSQHRFRTRKRYLFCWKSQSRLCYTSSFTRFSFELFWKTDPSLPQHDELGQETHITNEVHDYLAFKVFFVSVFLLGQDFTRFIRVKEPNISYVMISYYTNMIYSLKSPFKAYFLMGLTLNVFVAVTKGDKIKRVKYNRLEMTIEFLFYRIVTELNSLIEIRPIRIKRSNVDLPPFLHVNHPFLDCVRFYRLFMKIYLHFWSGTWIFQPLKTA